MDGGATDESYNLVFTAVKAVEGVKNPHRTRMRKTGGLWDIDIDIEVQPDITVREAHGIAVNVEKAIRNALSDVFDIVVHVEPYGDNRAGEQYGVSK
ncbi:MAG: cation transporter, partial [Spirochaetaceae bacterium]|jgi:divalent metal cation (Fe/Co/Zn/Cd) transporter|nr:cation transporter [Spirochaetaceae bacterium]